MVEVHRDGGVGHAPVVCVGGGDVREGESVWQVGGVEGCDLIDQRCVARAFMRISGDDMDVEVYCHHAAREVGMDGGGLWCKISVNSSERESDGEVESGMIHEVCVGLHGISEKGSDGLGVPHLTVSFDESVSNTGNADEAARAVNNHNRRLIFSSASLICIYKVYQVLLIFTNKHICTGGLDGRLLLIVTRARVRC